MYATLSANPPAGAFSPSVTVSEAFEPSAADAVELSAKTLVLLRTVTVYFCVLSSWAVTSTSMTLSPAAESAMAALAVPLVTDASVVPCLPTFTVASDWFTVGVIFTCVTLSATVTE